MRPHPDCVTVIIIRVLFVPWAIIRVHYSPMPTEVVSIRGNEDHGLDTIDREDVVPMGNC